MEFAIAAPMLLLVFGGVSDYAMLIWTKSRLASAVAQGAQYAFGAGAGMSAGSVASVVQTAGSLSGAIVVTSGPTCYCLSGTPAARSAQPCSQVCPDGVNPGRYLQITASYVYQPVFPLLSGLAGTTVSDSVFARLQ